MFERVFLSFDYERDAPRAASVGSCAAFSASNACLGLIDANDWHRLARFGPTAQKAWVDRALASATVTLVLIGGETEASPWVHYQILQSRARGRGVFGVHVHRIADPRTGRCDYKGRSPFERTFASATEPAVPLSEIYPVYDWVGDDGPSHLEAWVHEASERANASRNSSSTRRPNSQPVVKHGTFPTSRHVSEDWSPAPFIAER